MEFSMAIYAYNFVTYAASDAARYASLHGSHSSSPATLTALETRVRSSAVALVRSRILVNKNTDDQGNPIEDTPDHPAGFSPWIQANGLENNNPGSVVTVRVTYQVHPLVNLVIKNFMKVSSTSQMTIAN
jgi:Flp pilus assembly protein TadG